MEPEEVQAVIVTLQNIVWFTLGVSLVYVIIYAVIDHYWGEK